MKIYTYKLSDGTYPRKAQYLINKNVYGTYPSVNSTLSIDDARHFDKKHKADAHLKKSLKTITALTDKNKVLYERYKNIYKHYEQTYKAYKEGLSLISGAVVVEYETETPNIVKKADNPFEFNFRYPQLSFREDFSANGQKLCSACGLSMYKAHKLHYIMIGNIRICPACMRTLANRIAEILPDNDQNLIDRIEQEKFLHKI